MNDNDVCANCGQPIELARSSGWTVQQGVRRDPLGWTREWFHVGGGTRCLVPDWRGLPTLANPPLRCPQCSSTEYTITAEPWGNAHKCAACGHRQFVSIGD